MDICKHHIMISNGICFYETLFDIIKLNKCL